MRVEAGLAAGEPGPVLADHVAVEEVDLVVARPPALVDAGVGGVGERLLVRRIVLGEVLEHDEAGEAERGVALDVRGGSWS